GLQFGVHRCEFRVGIVLRSFGDFVFTDCVVSVQTDSSLVFDTSAEGHSTSGEGMAASQLGVLQEEGKAKNSAAGSHRAAQRERTPSTIAKASAQSQTTGKDTVLKDYFFVFSVPFSASRCSAFCAKSSS